jgi:hypothetical protein
MGGRCLSFTSPDASRETGAQPKIVVLSTAAMFQTYTETADRTKGAERTALLRAKLKELRLDGFIRAPTNIRANTCRRRPSGSPG